MTKKEVVPVSGSLELLKSKVGGDPTELIEYALDVLELQDEQDALNKSLKECDKNLSIAKDILLSKMLEIGIENFETEEFKAKRTEFIAPYVNKEDREAQMEWLREVGGESLIVETVNYQKFGGFVRNDFIPQLPKITDPVSGKEIPDLSLLPSIIQLKPVRQVKCDRKS